MLLGVIDAHAGSKKGLPPGIKALQAHRSRLQHVDAQELGVFDRQRPILESLSARVDVPERGVRRSFPVEVNVLHPDLLGLGYGPAEHCPEFGQFPGELSRLVVLQFLPVVDCHFVG